VAEKVRDRAVLYLEFGVFEGASLRFWSRALRNPEARLDGFDSFCGLPEDFDVNGPIVRETFDVGGRIPRIDDPRVRFFKGWFSDTLPEYEVPPHEVLVIVLDADLYSSTRLVLDRFRPWINAGRSSTSTTCRAPSTSPAPSRTSWERPACVSRP
jgi:hypothetical protein